MKSLEQLVVDADEDFFKYFVFYLKFFGCHRVISTTIFTISLRGTCDYFYAMGTTTTTTTTTTAAPPPIRCPPLSSPLQRNKRQRSHRQSNKQKIQITKFSKMKTN